MASIFSVKELYNRIAILTGFPIYEYEEATPETTRFLLEMITDGLNTTLANIYNSNSTKERTDNIKTIKGQDLYQLQGLVKYAEIIDVDDNGRVYKLPFGDNAEFHRTKEPTEPEGKPRYYVISNNYLRLFPTPDKEYTIKLVMSSDDIILAADDSYTHVVSSIDDRIIGSKNLEEVLKLKTAALILARCNNPSAQLYNQLATEKLQSYVEETRATTQGARFRDLRNGNYNPKRGLLG